MSFLDKLNHYNIFIKQKFIIINKNLNDIYIHLMNDDFMKIFLNEIEKEEIKKLIYNNIDKIMDGKFFINIIKDKILILSNIYNFKMMELKNIINYPIHISEIDINKFNIINNIVYYDNMDLYEMNNIYNTPLFYYNGLVEEVRINFYIYNNNKNNLKFS